MSLAEKGRACEGTADGEKCDAGSNWNFGRDQSAPPHDGVGTRLFDDAAHAQELAPYRIDRRHVEQTLKQKRGQEVARVARKRGSGPPTWKGPALGIEF